MNQQSMKKKRRCIAILCCLLIAFTAIFQPNSTTRIEAATGYYFTVNGTVFESYSKLPLTTDTSNIQISGASGVDMSDASNIHWFVNNTDVTSGNSANNSSIIHIKDISTNKLQAKLERVGPGYAQVMVTFEKNNINYSLYLNVEVGFDIDRTDFVNALNSGSAVQIDRSVMLFKDLATTQQIKLVYSPVDNGLSGLQSDNASLKYSSSDKNVAEVDSKGIVKPVGAGVAIITVSTNNVAADVSQSPMKKTFKIVITPKAGKLTDTTLSSKVEQITDQSVTFKTNAKDPANLTWRVYKKSSTGLSIITQTTGVINYYTTPATGSTDFGTLTVANAQVGEYVLMGFTDSMYIPSDISLDNQDSVAVPYVKIYVDFRPKVPAYLVMNVNDTYDMANAAGIKGNSDYTITSSKNDIAGISNGTIYAKKSGTSVITVKNNTSGSSEIYTTNLTVVDGISLNMTEAYIYTAGELQLLATTTTDQSSVVWTSVLNPALPFSSSNDGSKYATVENGLIKGVSKGNAYIVATITIDGVVKQAYCLVHVENTVTKLTINPETVILDKTGFKTLKAEFDNNSTRSIPIKWTSSNPEIVEIAESSSTYANIAAKGVAGTVIITAINTENYIIGYSKVTVKESVSSITLSATSLNLMQSAKTYQLNATVNPSTATEQGVTWKSTNPSVATVNDKGLITLVAPGTTSIIATSVDNPSVTAVCNLTVGVSASGIKLDESSKVMYTGEKTKLSYVITPTNATNTAVTWSTSDSSVVNVDSNGNITAVKAGTAVIILKTADGLYMSTCTITVKEKATGLAFDVTSLELYVGKTYTITVTPTPATATDYTLTWASLDATIASVNEKGTITAKAAGKTMITATTSTGTILYCNVTVKAEATGLQLNYTEKTVVIGDTFDLKATIKPSAAASEVTVIWASSKTSVATVTSSGRIKGIKGGTAVITAKTSDGKFTAFCTVTVIEKVTSIKLNKTSYKLGLKKSYNLVATVKTNAATNPKVKWKSSNTKVVTVDQKGKITGKAIGTATITVTALDGSGVTATSSIRVVRSVTSVTLNRTAVTTVVGKSFTLKATVKPNNSTYRTVTWKSSDESVAIVDSAGKVTALKAGNVTIKASAKDSSGKYAISYVIVQPRVPSNSVTIMNQNLTMVVGETAILEKALNPATSTDTVKWASDNKSVADVTTSGKLTAKRPGIANLTVMTESGKTATTKVTVVGLNTTNLVLEQYSDYTLYVLGISSNVSWDVVNSDIAVVTNGKVSTRRTGTTTIIANVNGRRLTCKLTVTKIK
ncbi:Ig-like domain-containing protein [Clostridium sp. KNHs205]|uniref:Ig-like domain-containing protein n=1 Tax=Clostridium sp. KNHs205 TaxID=1449050 RepID=UPI0006915182|nr:Ig-like domain-containing protein [Clostridium sp. KNHs205]